MTVKKWPNGLGEDRIDETGMWEIWYLPDGNYGARFFPAGDKYPALIGGYGTTPEAAMATVHAPEN